MRPTVCQSIPDPRAIRSPSRVLKTNAAWSTYRHVTSRNEGHDHSTLEAPTGGGPLRVLLGLSLQDRGRDGIEETIAFFLGHAVPVHRCLKKNRRARGRLHADARVSVLRG
jgi:hypothetical protein